MNQAILICMFLLHSLFLLAALTGDAHAWGDRGHAIVCETAAYLLEGGQGGALRDTSFELAYYCNVPDLLWKVSHKAVEQPEHAINLEIFDRAAPEKDWSELRKTFFSKHPDIPKEAGRAPWRVAELVDRAMALARKLKASQESEAETRAIQLKWLTTIGTLGHYVGDLSQPFHTTENYDGQLTGQRGIHRFFEISVVNQMDPGLSEKVFRKARAMMKKAAQDQSAFACALALARDSSKSVKKVLDLDKKVGRDSLPLAVKTYQDLVVERLASGAVALATLWRQASDFTFDSKFRDFDATPEFIPPDH